MAALHAVAQERDPPEGDGRGAIALTVQLRGTHRREAPELHLAPRFPLGLAVFFANGAASLWPLAVSRYF